MLWTLMKLGLLPVRGHMLAVIVLVPLWGPLLVVLLSVRGAVFGEGLKESALESLRFNDDLHRSILVHERDADAGVVPLEEALIVNDPAERRRLMLSMLTEEPNAYLAQLQAAKLNDDVEVAHYAATAVAQISKESDLKLQQLERAFKTDPSAQNLNEYCDFLGEYLGSGLAEGRVAQIQRQPRGTGVLAQRRGGPMSVVQHIRDRVGHFRWMGLLVVWAVFIAMAAVLLVERAGVQYSAGQHKLGMLAANDAVPASSAMFGQKPTCLVITDTDQAGVEDVKEQFDQILLDMKIAHRDVDLALDGADAIPSLTSFDRVILLMPSLDRLGTHLTDIMSWVSAGGSLMLAIPPDNSSYLQVIAPKLGIESAGYDYVKAESIVPSEDFMLGGGERYELSDPFDSSLSVSLRETAREWAKTGDAGAPLIWSNDCGSGRTVVCNIGIYDKVMRGFYAAAISLLGDATAYPVITSSVFYLDDFPSPVPSGDGTYIKRDYGLSIADFYAKVWWPDLQKLAQKYGVRFTGVMIENYEDAVNQTEPARQADTTQFRYFGGMLLQMGGELGFHGYNHQPLALWDTDYGTLYDYKTWKNKETLVASLDELIAFQDEVLPNAHGSVYVPPSNILSARARKIIGEDVPRIKTIASTYFEDGTDLPYVQEFGVASDGIVEQPRIVSGGMVGDSYMRLAAVSELNMHYVSTHFMHPDDLLDPDRGAMEGWEVYKGGLTDYLDWLTKSAPDLRRQTGSECAGAIQRFSSVTVSVDTSADAWTLSLGNFHDEAWLMFRANIGEPGAVTGGEIMHLTGDLYLVKATDKTVTIARKEGGDK